MLIRFLKDHGPHPAGREFDHPAPGVAETLIARGIAEEAEDAEDAEETTGDTKTNPPAPKNQGSKRRA